MNWIYFRSNCINLDMVSKIVFNDTTINFYDQNGKIIYNLYLETKEKCTKAAHQIVNLVSPSKIEL